MKTITAWRLAKNAFASTLWSGVGARDYGGRWNSKGVTVIYASESRALAAMEQLVHLVKPRVLKGYVVASITFEQARVHRVEPRSLPPGWDDPVAPPSLRAYGDNLVAAGRRPVLAVPSATISGEWNYVINPAHPEFAGMSRSIPQPFVYDARLA